MASQMQRRALTVSAAGSRPLAAQHAALRRPHAAAVCRAAAGDSLAPAAAPQAPSVVVTGASSGIGKATAVRLAAEGWRVYAGVRSDRAADEVRALSPQITPVTIDVTSTASVRAAAAEVRAAVGPQGLQGLVNNAGFGIFLPVEHFPEEAWASVMDVNVTGVLRCTQAFLPLLREGPRRGRVVNMSSIAGSLSFPLFGAYSASKHALEAMSDALRFELMPQGIPVSIVKPGPVVTSIWETARRGSDAAGAPPEAQALYGDLITRTRQLTEDSERDGIPADAVAAVVLEALSARSPRARYLVGNAPGLHILRRLLPDRLLNPLLASYYSL